MSSSLRVFIVCTFWATALSDFWCNNGTNIATTRFCDGKQNCDGSDEISGNASCPLCLVPQISCTISSHNKSCLLHREYFCNGTVTCEGLTPCDVGCPSHYKCQNSNRCFPRTTVCDGNFRNGCPEDDEWETGIGFQCVRNGKYCRLPQQMLWDNVKDCDDGSDLCYSTNVTVYSQSVRNPDWLPSFIPKRCHICLDEKMIIPRVKVCDGIIDCADLSDECLCENQVATLCDHVQLRTNRKLLHPCLIIGQVHCGTPDGKCVNQSKICDGVADCSNNMDEKYDYCRGTLSCQDGQTQDAMTSCRCPIDGHKRLMATLCDGKGDCTLAPPGEWVQPPGYPEDECVAKCPNSTAIKRFNCTVPIRYGFGFDTPFTGTCQTYVRLPNGTKTIESITYDNAINCDGILDCTADGRDEQVCISRNLPQHCCRNRFMCKSGEKISILMSQLCDGRVDCDDGTDESLERCRQQFRCPSLSGTKVSIPKRSVCDLITNCDNAEDEMKCTEDGRFYCTSGNPLFIKKHQILDGRGDCSDWSDECSNLKAAFALSSPQQLIADPILGVILFIMAFLALFGNLAVIVGEIKEIKRECKPMNSEVASVRANRMLVLNLAVADFLMGVYLFCLGIACLSYQSSYCSQALAWLTSNSCIAMGVLVVLSSETSVLTMVFLSLTRTLSVYYPIDSLTKPSMRSVMFMIAFSWIVSFILAFLPLSSYLQNSFVERALIESNPFFKTTDVHFDAVKSFSIKLFTYSPHFSIESDSVLQKVYEATSWNELHKIIPLSLDNYLLVSTYFGYYSANSVCIPNFFVTRNDWSWRFSLSVTILNLLLSVYSAVTFCALLRRAEATRVDSPKTSKTQKSLQRKIIRLILTDFCCWIPLSIMVFVNFSGVMIDSVAYAVAAIVLLPINSALNPILYSNFIENVWEKFKKGNKNFYLSW